jgi:plastocyanin
MRNRTFAALTGAAFAVGLAAGCMTAESRPPQQFKVGMGGATYSPGTVQARVGDSIRFVNDDREDHTVFVPTFGHGIDFGTLKPGQEAVLALAKPGRFRVECVPHPDMLVDVVVVR